MASERSRSRSLAASFFNDTSWLRSEASLSAALTKIGHHGAEENRAPHRGERILGPDQDRRRRPPANSLQRRQHFRQDIALLDERGVDRLLVAGQRLDSGLGLVDFAFQGLRALARLDQRLIEGGAILVEGFDLAAKLGQAVLGEGDVIGDGVQFGLAGGAGASSLRRPDPPSRQPATGRPRSPRPARRLSSIESAAWPISVLGRQSGG